MDVDFVVIACRPVDWSSMGRFAIKPETYVYPGSIVQDCSDCGNQIYVGPKAQEFLREYPEHPVHCFLCASRITAGIDTTIHHFGNTFRKKEI